MSGGPLVHVGLHTVSPMVLWNWVREGDTCEESDYLPLVESHSGKEFMTASSDTDDCMVALEVDISAFLLAREEARDEGVL